MNVSIAHIKKLKAPSAGSVPGFQLEETSLQKYYSVNFFSNFDLLPPFFMITVTFTHLVHRKRNCMALRFPYDFALKEYLKLFDGVSYSDTHRCFYILYSEEKISLLKAYLLEGGYAIAGESSSLKTWGEKEKASTTLPPLPPDKLLIHKNYVDFLYGKRYSHSTVSVYSNFVGEFLRFHAWKLAELFNENDVRLYIEWAVKELNYSISTHRQLVSAFKQFAYFYPLCEINPEKLIRPKKDRKLPTVLSMEEVLQLLQVTRNLKHKTIIALLYSAGLRVGELVDLELKSFDFNRKQLRVQMAKGRKDRYTNLAESVIPLLKMYYHAYQPKHYFIENPSGGKYSAESIRSFLKQNCTLAGISKRVTPHTLRHSYATHLLEHGTDLRLIQELLGHSKPETTMIYTHVSSQQLQEIRSPLDVALNKFHVRDSVDEKLVLSLRDGWDNPIKT